MKKNIAEVYLNGRYAHLNPNFGDDNATWKIDNAIKAIDLYGIKVSNLAEVGCGGGGILLGLADALKVGTAVGYEPMPEAYQHAKSRERKGVAFVNDTVDASTEGDFDLALCFDVFEHVEDCFGFLRGLQGISKNFLFHIPLDMNVQMVARATPIQRVRDQVGHIHYYSRETAIELLKHCGYTVKGEFYTSAAESNYQGGLGYKVANIVRKILFKLNGNLTARLLGGYSLMVYATID